MSEWITDRLPTEHEKPKKYVVRRWHSFWGIYNTLAEADAGRAVCYVHGIPTKEAAEKIAEIINEVQP